MIVIKKNLESMIKVYYNTNLICHLYIILLKICKLYLLEKLEKKTQEINIYNN